MEDDDEDPNEIGIGGEDDDDLDQAASGLNGENVAVPLEGDERANDEAGENGAAIDTSSFRPL